MADMESQSDEEAPWARPDIHVPLPESFYDRVESSDDAEESKKGRPKAYRNENFIQMSHNSFKSDNLRSKIIRSFNKAIRAILSYLESNNDQILELDETMVMDDSRERSILHLLNPSKHSDIRKWKELAKFVKDHKKLLKSKSRCSNEPPNNKFKSFNTKFCKKFFGVHKMRHCLRLYLDLVFNYRSPEEYILRFNMLCCRSKHRGECYDKWDLLRADIESILLGK